MYTVEQSKISLDQYLVTSGNEIIAKGLTKEAANTIANCVNIKDKVVSLLEKAHYSREQDRTEAQEILKELYKH